MEQRFVVNGINNDKIELVSKYDVRKLNRLLDAKDKMWLVKVKQARDDIKSISQEVPYRNQAFSYGISICETDSVLKILDKLISESEQ